jgi:Ras-related C3 botulinum toxin substrate 1
METFIKCYIFGDPNVGKSSLLYTFAKNSFITEDEEVPFQNYIVNMTWKEETVSLCLYDNIKESELRKLTIQDMDIFLVCYSDDKSFLNVEDVWIPEIKQYAPFTPIILVSTKSDLSENKSLDKAKGLQLQKKIKSDYFIQCSAKNQENVKECYQYVIERVKDSDRKLKKGQSKGTTKKKSLGGMFDSDFSDSSMEPSFTINYVQEKKIGEGTIVDLEKIVK